MGSFLWANLSPFPSLSPDNGTMLEGRPSAAQIKLNFLSALTDSSVCPSLFAFCFIYHRLSLSWSAALNENNPNSEDIRKLHRRPFCHEGFTISNATISTACFKLNALRSFRTRKLFLLFNMNNFRNVLEANMKNTCIEPGEIFLHRCLSGLWRMQHDAGPF